MVFVKCILSQFQRLEIWNQGVDRLDSFLLGSGGKSAPPFFLTVLAGNPWHSLACSRVPPIFAFVITQSSPRRFPSFSEELQVIGLRVSLLVIRTHHDYICKAPISKYGHIYRNQGVRGEGNDNPLPYSCLESPVDRGAWWAAVHGVAQSQTRLKRLSMCACIEEGNGNPLQYSCLENPRDRGAWWAAVYGIAQSWRWLKRLSSSSRGLGVQHVILGGRAWGTHFDPHNIELPWGIYGFTMLYACVAARIPTCPSASWMTHALYRTRLAGVTAWVQAEGWKGGARLLLCGGGEAAEESRWTTQDVWARQGGIFHGCCEHTSLPAVWFKSPWQENLKRRIWAEDALFFLLISSLAFGEWLERFQHLTAEKFVGSSWKTSWECSTEMQQVKWELETQWVEFMTTYPQYLSKETGKCVKHCCMIDTARPRKSHERVPRTVVTDSSGLESWEN